MLMVPKCQQIGPCTRQPLHTSLGTGARSQDLVRRKIACRLEWGGKSMTCTVASMSWVERRYSRCCSAAALLSSVCSSAAFSLGAMLASCSRTVCFCFNSSLCSRPHIADQSQYSNADPMQNASRRILEQIPEQCFRRLVLHGGYASIARMQCNMHRLGDGA